VSRRVRLAPPPRIDLARAIGLPAASTSRRRKFRMSSHILAIDQGHHLVARHLFRADISIAAVARRSFRSTSRRRAGSSTSPTTSGHDARHCREAMRKAGSRLATSPPSASPTSARPPWCGDRATGAAGASRLVWQDRRTAEICARLKADGLEPEISGAHRPH